MIRFNQIIRPGQSGGDVKAVKNTLRRMHVPGSGSMTKNDHYGPASVKCVEHVQRTHNIHVDGIYGPSTHELIAPHFSAWDKIIYARAKKRNPYEPPIPPGDASAAAKKLIAFHREGKFHDDSGRIMAQIEATAIGKPVWSQAGRYVHLDQRMLKGLVWLVESGYHIGCFAMCSDHPYDSMLGHAGGRAVDISSVNRISISSHSPQSRQMTLKLVVTMHKHMVAPIRPWQLICDGYGYTHDSDISAQTIPNADFYGPAVMKDHRNHAHYGV
jgi:hypothetical protein